MSEVYEFVFLFCFYQQWHHDGNSHGRIAISVKVVVNDTSIQQSTGRWSADIIWRVSAAFPIGLKHWKELFGEVEQGGQSEDLVASVRGVACERS